jgi:hypothetical protein
VAGGLGGGVGGGAGAVFPDDAVLLTWDVPLSMSGIPTDGEVVAIEPLSATPAKTQVGPGDLGASVHCCG